MHVPIEKLHQLRHVCGNHLKKKDFNKKGNRLRKRAIPMVNLTATPLTDVQLIGFPQHICLSSNGEGFTIEEMLIIYHILFI